MLTSLLRPSRLLLSRPFSSPPPSRPPVVLVVGAGEAIGAAVCRRFAQEGFTVVAVRRSKGKLDALRDEINGGGGAAAATATSTAAAAGGGDGTKKKKDAKYSGTLVLRDGVDARSEEQVVSLVTSVELELGPIECCVYNIGGNIKFPLLETTTQKFTKCWDMACLSGFLVGREVSRSMLPRGRGTLLYTGATASLRGGSGFSAFSVAKGGLRNLAMAMAKELGPKGLHVGHVVVDGAVDTPWIREHFREMVEKAPPQAIVDPNDVAEAYWYLHNQRKSAWTFEMDLRPYCEKW